MASSSGVLAVERGARPVPGVNIADFWALTKPEVNFLILIATSTGFYLGYPGNLDAFPFQRLIDTLLGTLLVRYAQRRGRKENLVSRNPELGGICPFTREKTGAQE